MADNIGRAGVIGRKCAIFGSNGARRKCLFGWSGGKQAERKRDGRGENGFGKDNEFERLRIEVGGVEGVSVISGVASF